MLVIPFVAHRFSYQTMITPRPSLSPIVPKNPPRPEIDRPRPEGKVRRYLPLPSAPKRKLSSISDFGGLGERQRTEHATFGSLGFGKGVRRGQEGKD